MRNTSIFGTIALLFLTLPVSAEAAKTVVREDTCRPQTKDAPVLHNEDFDWGQSLTELKERADRLYASEKRLEERAYVNAAGDIVLPYDSFSGGEQEIKLTDRFILSIRGHIEKALKRNYIDEVIFSDMGHSHFFVPKDFYENVLNPIPREKRHIMYQKLMAHKDLKVLYHTAEQLDMLDEDKELLDNRHLQWRFFTRNLIGDNKAQANLDFLHNEEHDYNTARSFDENHKYWGAGFYLSANKNGCFPFVHNGKTYYFDLNLSGFKPQGGSGGGYYKKPHNLNWPTHIFTP